MSDYSAAKQVEPDEDAESERPKDDKDEAEKQHKEGSKVDTEGVTVPEEFQAKVHELTHKATKPHLDHMRSKINEREDAMKKEEAMKQKGKKVKDFSSEDMPEPSYGG
jgi:hypothetical protein